MIKRLRFKFVCVNMAIVAVMLAVIFGLVLNFTKADLQKKSIQFLQSGIPAMGRPAGPGEHKVQVPWFAVYIGNDGKKVTAGNVGYDLTDEAFTGYVIEQALNAREPVGTISRYQLRFFRSDSPGGRMLSFVDISAEINTMQTLWRSCILIGLAGLGTFFVISLFLSRWAVRPVETAWQQQRQFVADASHELKTPLTVVLTNAELLGDPRYGEEERSRMVQSICAMSVQMRGLVEGLLELARVDNGVVRKTFSLVDLSRLAREELLPFEPVFFEKGLQLRSDVGEGLRVKGSAAHLRQVFGILLDNAAKYARQGSVVEVSLKRQGRSALLTVANPGEPLSKQEQKDIFKRFYRKDKARSRDGSYGLGLPIAQGIVTDHAGKIWAQSSGDINCFYVQLPLA